MSGGLQFPFAIDDAGLVEKTDNRDQEIHGKIVQVLFTAPGERMNKPDFGCGLLNLNFEPNDEILAAALEFTIGQALVRWLADDIIVEGVEVTSKDEFVTATIVYTVKKELRRGAVRVSFK